jgi:hypothetical protein
VGSVILKRKMTRAFLKPKSRAYAPSWTIAVFSFDVRGLQRSESVAYKIRGQPLLFFESSESSQLSDDFIDLSVVACDLVTPDAFTFDAPDFAGLPFDAGFQGV